ncbi:hypothetical protein ACIOYV_22235 [Pseudomonas sp. NPDC087342]|uniref:hypothetical protein n=1 Tax=Pseudomonas sp. NPDC087342 TaxID=3364437 RepID=UPI00382853EA
MNFNTNTFKCCTGPLVLIAACTLSTHTFADDQTYTCGVTLSIPGQTVANTSDDIQASSAEDAKNKITEKYRSTKYLVLSVFDCKIKQ